MRTLYAASGSASASCRVSSCWSWWLEVTWRPSWDRTDRGLYVYTTPFSVILYICLCGTLNWAVLSPGPEFLSHTAGAAANGQRHCLWLSIPGGKPLHTQVKIHSQLILLQGYAHVCLCVCVILRDTCWSNVCSKNKHWAFRLAILCNVGFFFEIQICF